MGLGIAFERDATAREAHDLSRDRQTDTAASLFGREEGDEDVVDLFLRNERTVVAHLYDDRFVGIAIALQLDVAVGLFATDGLHGILQQIEHHLRD